MKDKSKPKTGRIHIHIHRGMVERVTSRGLGEPVEVLVHDHDCMPTTEISVYRLGSKFTRRGGSKKKVR